MSSRGELPLQPLTRNGSGTAPRTEAQQPTGGSLGAGGEVDGTASAAGPKLDRDDPAAAETR